jgi:CubicO group peptidase (beta-lactamase class C family)
MHPTTETASVKTRTTLERTAQLLHEEVAAGLWTKGAQVGVVIGGSTHRLAIGDAGTGNPVADDTIFKIYCAIKPVATVAIAQQVEAGNLDLDRPLRELMPAYRVLHEQDITLRHVLSHTAGLHVPPTVELELLPIAQRQVRLEQATGLDDWKIGEDAAYSEYFGWHLIGRLLEVVSGQPLRQHLRDAVLDPLGLTNTWIGMTETEYDQNLDRLGLSWRLEGPKTTPMLLEHSPRWCTEVNCASGGYTTATDFASFYAAVARQLNHSNDPALPSAETLELFCSPARPWGYDRVLGRACDYGLGVMIHLEEHYFGTLCSDRAFGQTGLAGSSFGFADPAHELSAVVILNGIIDGPSSLTRRQRITEAIYEDCANHALAEPQGHLESERQH